MKKNLFTLLLVVAVCTGCVHYDIVLNNGMVITAHGKPHLDKEKGRYLYTDASGKDASVPVSKVQQITPHTMRSKPGSQFIPQ